MLSCSASKDLQGHYYVDIMFASTLERAANSASVTRSSRNHKTSDKRNEGVVTDKKISQTIADICGIQHALYMWICLA